MLSFANWGWAYWLWDAQEIIYFQGIFLGIATMINWVDNLWVAADLLMVSGYQKDVRYSNMGSLMLWKNLAMNKLAYLWSSECLTTTLCLLDH